MHFVPTIPRRIWYAALRELIAKCSTRDAFLVASVYAFRNQRDEAFEWLDRAYAQHEDDLAVTNLLPVLKNLPGRPAICRVLGEAPHADLINARPSALLAESRLGTRREVVETADNNSRELTKMRSDSRLGKILKGGPKRFS